MAAAGSGIILRPERAITPGPAHLRVHYAFRSQGPPPPHPMHGPFKGTVHGVEVLGGRLSP